MSDQSVPVVVSVTDADGRPVPAAEVRFAASAGLLTASRDSTDADGQASVTWTLPSDPGTAQVAATTGGLTPVLFTATVSPIADPVVFRFLDAGGYHACGITTTEQLLCWGYGADGQLGLGATSPKPAPTLIPGDFRYRRVTGGYYHACAYTLATNAWCWGNNSDGRLGNGSTASESAIPVKVLTAETIDTIQGDTILGGGQIHLSVQEIQAGWAHSCGIDLSQHLYCWGRNGEGQIGRGVAIPGSAIANAVLILSVESYKSVAVGGLHSCAVTTAGGAQCWGYNAAGQLGDGTTATNGTPSPVSGGLAFRTDPLVIFRSPDPEFPLPPGPFLASGYDHTCGITTGGPTVCWGLNQHGQIGDNSLTNLNSPTTVAGGHTFAGITAGLRHTSGLDASGVAWCWGANDLGQLGDGTTDQASVPRQGGLGELTFAYVKAGELFTFGVTSAGVAYCWGDNRSRPTRRWNHDTILGAGRGGLPALSGLRISV